MNKKDLKIETMRGTGKGTNKICANQIFDTKFGICVVEEVCSPTHCKTGKRKSHKGWVFNGYR